MLVCTKASWQYGSLIVLFFIGSSRRHGTSQSSGSITSWSCVCLMISNYMVLGNSNRSIGSKFECRASVKFVPFQRQKCYRQYNTTKILIRHTHRGDDYEIPPHTPRAWPYCLKCKSIFFWNSISFQWFSIHSTKGEDV